MKNVTKNVLLVLVGVICAVPAFASMPSIPKITLAACTVEKEQVQDWFYVRGRGAAAEFASIVGRLQVNLEQVNLGDEPGIAAFSVLTIRGYNSEGVSVPLVQRDLRNIAVNFDEGVYSVAYTPYDVSRTLVAPFNLLIERNSGAQNATGYLTVVPLQASAQSPFATISMDCRIDRAPAEPIALDRSTFATMPPSTQFSVIYNLHRLRFMGPSNRAREITPAYLQSIGLAPQTFAQVKAQIAAQLSARPLPPERSSFGANTTVTIPESDRCGDVSAMHISPIYDSKTLREQRSSAQARQNAIGYVLSGIRCDKPAQIVNREGDRESKYYWRVDTVVLSPQGLIQGESFRASAYNLW